MKKLYTTWLSPIGELLLVGDQRSLHEVQLPGRHRRGERWTMARAPFATAIDQLDQYFAGERTEFDLRLTAR